MPPYTTDSHDFLSLVVDIQFSFQDVSQPTREAYNDQLYDGDGTWDSGLETWIVRVRLLCRWGQEEVGVTT